MGYEPGGVPSRSAGQLPSLEQDNVAPTFLCQVVGNGAADDSAADDDHTRLNRYFRHQHISQDCSGRQRNGVQALRRWLPGSHIGPAG